MTPPPKKKEEKDMGPKNIKTKRMPFLQKMKILGGCPGSRKILFFRGVISREINWFYLEVQGSFGG